MLRSYFFVPASKPRFIEKMPTIPADEFVFDFEDTVSESEKEQAHENILQLPSKEKYWVRPQLFNKLGEINDKHLESLLMAGFKRFFLPKINTPQQLNDIYNIFEYYDISDFQWILLLEDPLALCNINTILSEKKYPIIGIALGAQDYSAALGMQFSNERIQWARTVVLNAAHAHKVEAIDFASMVIQDKNQFEAEILEGFRMGHTAKIILHPNQLEVANSAKYYSQQEIDQAIKVCQEIDFSNLSDFSVIVVEGQLYEKLHLNRFQRILEYVNKNR